MFTNGDLRDLAVERAVLEANMAWYRMGKCVHVEASSPMLICQEYVIFAVGE